MAPVTDSLIASAQQPTPPCTLSTKLPTAVILAGGRGQRMQGRDKGLEMHQGKPLIEHVIAALPEALKGDLCIVANRHIAQYQTYSQQVFSDTEQNYQGPAAGLLAAHTQLHYKHTEQAILLLACDLVGLTPQHICDLIATWQQSSDAACLACDKQNTHYLTAIYPAQCLDSLAEYIGDGRRSMRDFVSTQKHRLHPLPDDCTLLNINRSEQLLSQRSDQPEQQHEQ